MYEIRIKNIPYPIEGKDSEINETENDKKYDEMHALLLDLFRKYGKFDTYEASVDNFNSTVLLYNGTIPTSTISPISSILSVPKAYSELNGKMFVNDFKPFLLDLQFVQWK